MNRRLLLCIAVMAALGSWSAPLLASSEGGGGSTDIFAGDLGMAVFTLLIFIALLVILGKYAWEPLLDGLKHRESHIRHSIEEAELAREEAFLTLKQYEGRLARAREEADAIIEEAREKAQQAGKELLEKAQTDATALRVRTEESLTAARAQVMRQIYEESADLATHLAGRIISQSLSVDDHRDLVRQSLSELQNKLHEN